MWSSAAVQAASSEPPRSAHSWALTTRSDRGDTSVASRAATCWVWASTSPAGSTALNRPMAAASSARRMRPVRSRSAALAGPTRRGSTHDSPCSAGRPRRANAVVTLAPAAAKRRSQKQARTRPTPAAAPFTAASTGFDSPRWNENAWAKSGRPEPGIGTGGAEPVS
ncbi:MAG TPA: hypothetical protein VF640_03475 [Acidimicrobiales bacterium]